MHDLYHAGFGGTNLRHFGVIFGEESTMSSLFDRSNTTAYFSTANTHADRLRSAIAPGRHPLGKG